MKKNRLKSQGGFALRELVYVLVILGVVGFCLYNGFETHRDKIQAQMVQGQEESK